MVILGIDPGYAIVGYGVVEYDNHNFTPIAYGAVTTPAGMDPNLRLEKVYDGICAIIDNYRPDAMAIEQLFFTSNQKTVIMVAEARGIILLAATKKQLPIYEYTPLQVKQAVVGYGRAIKNQVMEMTRRMLRLEKLPKPDDAADALAIAICHGHSAGSYVGKSRLEEAIAASQKKEEERRRMLAAQKNNQAKVK